MSFYKEVVKISKEAGQKQHANWSLKNTSDRTDYALWMKEIDNLGTEAETTLRGCIENIGQKKPKR